jgi:hypothetical protein
MYSKSRVIVLMIVTTMVVLGGFGTGCGRIESKAILQPPPSNSTNSEPAQLTNTISIIKQEEAITKARYILSQLSIDAGEFENAEIKADPVTDEEYWDIQFNEATVNISTVGGTVIGVSVRNWSKGKFVITSTPSAQKAAQELYSKLEAPAAYKLMEIKRGYTGDFWSANWQKEVIPGVYSKFESVNLLLSSDTGKLRTYRLFNSSPKSLVIKVTKEQAVETTKTIAEEKGFKTIVDTRLNVEQANGYWKGASLPNNEWYCTLVWVVTYKNSNHVEAKFYVDTATGLVIGGDQTK